MKIEKLSENQIRCTLNHADLAERELRISELAYGTEKAKELFRDMMQQASYEFGFEAEDLPLMIEAIPVSSDCIILVITKVEDPDELDTRFSKFAPSKEDVQEELNDEEELYDSETEDIASLFSKIQELRDAVQYNSDQMEQIKDSNEQDNTEVTDDFIPFKESLKSAVKKAKDNSQSSSFESGDAKEQHLFRVYIFPTLDKANDACAIFNDYRELKNLVRSALYKDTEKNYYLTLDVTTCQRDIIESFNRIGNLLSEFGSRARATAASESYYKEHFETIIKANAISVLSSL